MTMYRFRRDGEGRPVGPVRHQPPPGNVNGAGLQRHIVLRRRFRLRLCRFGGHHRRGGVHLNHRRFGQLQRRRGIILNGTAQGTSA